VMDCLTATTRRYLLLVVALASVVRYVL
jgi:hypothetical protein